MSSSLSQFAVPIGLDGSLPAPQREQAKQARKNLGDVIDRSFKKEDVVALMRQFHLDKAQASKKSAVEQFEIAWAAFERQLTQSSPINTSLIPMRECIETVIAELIRRRRNQEPARSQQDKIHSIGNQLSRPGIVKSVIVNWAIEWGRLVEELSGSKQVQLSREEWRNLLRRATLFLQGFLQGLDSTKLR